MGQANVQSHRTKMFLTWSVQPRARATSVHHLQPSDSWPGSVLFCARGLRYHIIETYSPPLSATLSSLRPPFECHILSFFQLNHLV